MPARSFNGGFPMLLVTEAVQYIFLAKSSPKSWSRYGKPEVETIRRRDAT